MCGIHGFAWKDTDRSVSRMIEAAKHRGPDGKGHWGDGFLTLGHNLLADNDNADMTFGGGGSTNGNDPYLEYTFTAPGTYVIGVAKFNSTIDRVVLGRAAMKEAMSTGRYRRTTTMPTFSPRATRASTASRAAPARVRRGPTCAATSRATPLRARAWSLRLTSSAPTGRS